MDGITNLFGSEFCLAVPDIKDLAKKAKPQQTTLDVQTEKILKSKKLSIHERLGVIRDKVIKILGKQIQNKA